MNEQKRPNPQKQLQEPGDYTDPVEETSIVVLDESEYLHYDNMSLSDDPAVNVNSDVWQAENSTTEIGGFTNVYGNTDLGVGGNSSQGMLHETGDDGDETTVEVMTMTEFIGCTEIGDKERYEKYLSDPMKMSHDRKRACRSDTIGVSPKNTVIGSIENGSVIGVSGIQTITRKDSETDNVVIIIRPRSNSPTDSRDRNGGQLDVSSYHDTHIRNADSRHRSQRSIYTRNSIENEDPESSSRSYRIESDSSDVFNDLDDANLQDDLQDMHLHTDKSNVPNPSAAGARPKRWVPMSMPDANHDDPYPVTDRSRSQKGSNKTGYTDSDELGMKDSDWDSEDRLIWELLKSMKSVTNRPSSQSDGLCDNDFDVDLTRKTDTIKPDDPDDGSSVDDDSHSLSCSKERHNSWDSFGEKERDKIISEKLQKREAGGMTCITFFSPSYQRPVTKFTPLQCKDTIKLDAKGFFQRGFESTRKGVPESFKVNTLSKQRTVAPSKIHSPRLFTQL